MEQKGINPEGVGLVALALAYLTATPGTEVKAVSKVSLHSIFKLDMQLKFACLCSGVLAGAIDYYIIAKLQNLRSDAVYVKVCCCPLCHEQHPHVLPAAWPALLTSTMLLQSFSRVSPYILSATVLQLHLTTAGTTEPQLQNMSHCHIHCCNLHYSWDTSAHCVHLQDDFKITKKIATGGFGTVYRAECDDGKTPGGRPVIIKKASRSLIPLCVSPQTSCDPLRLCVWPTTALHQLHLTVHATGGLHNMTLTILMWAQRSM